MLTAKRNAQVTFLSSVLQNEGKSWSEFYRFVNRCKGTTENIPATKNCNGGLITGNGRSITGNGGPITDPVIKANILSNYYASVFNCERNISDINSTHSDKLFTIKISIIRTYFK